MTEPIHAAQGFMPEVQGLRAVAVLLVVVYHLGLPYLPGGYIGVDVFFVISGFLITRLLLAEQAMTGRIDLWRFYRRRLRRIVPALVATIALCLLAGFVILAPEPFEALAESGLAAVLSVSNLLFWSQSGYFDADAITKPLLHTWSLGVEEQFYLFWPLVLSVVLVRFGRLRAVQLLALLASVSFLANLTVGYGWLAAPAASATEGADQAADVFFLPWFRVFEFAFGAALCFLRGRPRGWQAEAFSGIGIAMITVAAVMLDKSMIFPGLPALLPCIGAALVIASAGGTRTAVLLRTAPAQFLGRISYSLYLVHWPVVSFFYHVTFRTPTLTEAIACFALMLALAVALNRLVEEPVRYGRFAGRKTLVLATTGIFGLSLAIDQGEGWRWRIGSGDSILTAKEYREQESRYCAEATIASDLVTCEIGPSGGRTIYVWGDSHARHLVPGLAALLPDTKIRILYRSSCMAQSGVGTFFYDFEGRTELADGCSDRNRRALEFMIGLPEPATILLSNYVRPGMDDSPAFVSATQELLDRLRSAGHSAVLLGDVIRPEFDATVCSAKVPALMASSMQDRCKIDPAAAQVQIDIQDTLLATLGAESFIPTADIFCSGSDCRIWQDNELLFRDHHHLTPNGSRLFMRDVLERLTGSGIITGADG